MQCGPRRLQPQVPRRRAPAWPRAADVAPIRHHGTLVRGRRRSWCAAREATRRRDGGAGDAPRGTSLARLAGRWWQAGRLC